MHEARAAQPFDAVACPSCGAEHATAFCPACGERRPDPDALSMRHLAAEAFEHVSSFDVKLVRTVGTLFRRPGLLLAEYRRGARVRYTPPTQLFVLTSVAFFVVVPALSIFDYRTRILVDPARLGTGWWDQVVAARVRAARSPEAYRLAYNAAVGTRMQSLFGLVVPVFAAALAVLLPSRRVVEHVVAAVHLAPVYMAALVLSFLGLRAGAGVRAGDGNAALLVLVASGVAAFAAHAACAVRRGYGVGWARAAAAGAALGGVAFTFPRLYFEAVRHATVLLLPH